MMPGVKKCSASFIPVAFLEAAENDRGVCFSCGLIHIIQIVRRAFPGRLARPVNSARYTIMHGMGGLDRLLSVLFPWAR